VKLLFDENLSPRLVQRLDAIYPGSMHVEFIGLRGQPDQALWDYAGFHGFTLVSKDNDFRQLSFLKGAPPKVIWLSVGNAGTDAIAKLLEDGITEIALFHTNTDESLLVLELPI
jgi:predicted nuclease of predicted toxin-antitoxin system